MHILCPLFPPEKERLRFPGPTVADKISSTSNIKVRVWFSQRPWHSPCIRNTAPE